MISKLLLRNLRSLQDTGFVSLRPLTLLVGKNNSGKSTFLRTLPLLKQSVETRTRGPILWFGNSVDFGDYASAVTHQSNVLSEEDGITFGFELNIVEPRRRASAVQALRRESALFLKRTTCRLYLTVNTHDDTTYTSCILIELYDAKCQINFSGPDAISSISVNGYVYQPRNNEVVLPEQGQLLPNLIFFKDRQSKSNEPDRRDWYIPRQTPLQQELFRFINNSFVHGNTSSSTISSMIEEMAFGPVDKLRAHFLTDINAPASWHASVKEASDSKFQRLCDRLFAAKLPLLIRHLDQRLSAYLRGIRYLEPVRATAQRYYRNQDLAVDEIDSTGANIAMFLGSLRHSEQDEFSKWVSESFGFHVRPNRSGGHLELMLRAANSDIETNMADMGFGFSQLLPIATQLWAMLRSDRRRAIHQPHSCVVLEQPELHLHPELQARVADVMANIILVAKRQRQNFTIVAETHSQSIVNRCGELVAKGIISSDDVGVVLFEQAEDHNITSIRTSPFDKDGRLVDWPWGFFEPS